MGVIRVNYKEIESLKKLLRDKMVEAVEGDMVWARFRYDEGGYDYAERIEFADFYFELSDILEELYSINEYHMSEFLNLQLKIEDAYSSLGGAVML